MPASRLTDEPQAIGRFDVIGMERSKPYLVRHVALSLFNRSARLGEKLHVAHMCPPFEQNPNEETCACHSFGTADLTADDEEEIKLFLDELDGEYQAATRRIEADAWCVYVAYPNKLQETEADGTVVFTRYSCATLVMDAYEAIEVVLIVPDENEIPSLTIEQIGEVFPAILRDGTKRQQILLGERSDWPVVLPGYILHAMNRPADHVRQEAYVPDFPDAYFPHETPVSPADGTANNAGPS